jgi:hypothetical protein
VVGLYKLNPVDPVSHRQSRREAVQTREPPRDRRAAPIHILEAPGFNP